MLNHKIFTDGMNKLAVAFPGITNLARMQRYYAAVASLPDEAFDDVVNDLLDTARSMPLPKDFLESARVWRANFYRQNGSYYAEKSKIEEGDGIDCRKCGDLGYLKITHKNPEIKLLTVMRCHCEMGGRGSRDIPEWDNALLTVYNCEPCPISWFKPDLDVNSSNDAALLGTLFKKASGWRDFIKKSEAYWKAVKDA